MRYIPHLIFVAVFVISCSLSAQSITYSAPVEFEKYSFEGSYDVSTQTSLNAFAFNGDGTRMYAIGLIGNVVYEYSLTSPYDVMSTVNYTGNSLTTGLTASFSLSFNNDGSKLYTAGFQGPPGQIEQYSLSTPYQVHSGATLDGSFFVQVPSGVTFSADGSKMFVTQDGSIHEVVSQHTLNTPFDPNGGWSAYSELDVSGQQSSLRGLVFNSSGTKMFISDGAFIHQYNLSTPYTITSGVTYNGTPTVDFSTLYAVGGLQFNTNNSRLYLARNNEVIQYVREEVFVESIASDGSVNGSLDVHLNGDSFVNAGSNLSYATHYTLSNVPPGLTPQIVVDASGAFATLSFTGNATVWNDVSDIQFTFTDAAFVNSTAASVLNAVSASSNLGIEFNERFLTFNPSIDITTSTAVGHQSGQLDVSGELTVPAGMTFSNDGTKLFVTGLDAAVHQYSLSQPFNITSGVSNDGVPLDISGEEVFPQDVAFNPAGTKMFIVGSVGQEVNQYSLAIPFDISDGVSHDGSPFNVSAEDALPFGIAFNNNGTRMFIVGGTGKELNQYSLTHPFDITSGVTADSGPLDLSVENTNPRGVAFNSTGTRLFIVSEGTNEVNQYTLGNAFDITSGVTFSGSPLDISGEESNATDIGFSGDGTTMYILGLGDDEINQYSLQTPFTESVSNDGTILGSATIGISGDTFTSQGGTFTHGVEYSISNLPSGLTPNLAISGNGQAAIFTITGTASPHTSVQGIGSLEFTFNNSAFTQGDAGIFTNATSAESNLPIIFIDQPSLSLFSPVSLKQGFTYSNDPWTSIDGNSKGVAFNDDGTQMVIVGSLQDRMQQFLLSTPYDITTAGDQGLSSVSIQTNEPRDIHFSPDGSHLYILTNSDIKQFSLSTPFRVLSGVTFEGSSTNITAQTGNPGGMAFSNDGTKLFLTGTSFSVNQYSLTTPFDVTSGMTFDGSPLSISAYQGIIFNNQGTKMFVGNGSMIYEYHLSTPFDVTAGVTEQPGAMNISIFETQIEDIETNNDGSKLYIMGLGSGAQLNQIDLNLNYDVSTIGPSHDGEYDVKTYDQFPEDVTFSNDGMTMFVVGRGPASSTQEINYFSLTAPFDVTSGVTADGSLDVSVSGMLFTSSSLAFNDDGTTLFVLGTGVDDMVFQYSLTTPFDLSSGVSYDDSPFDVSAEEAGPHGLTFSEDGTKMFIVGNGGSEINQYSLSSPFTTTSGVSFDGNPFDISTETTTPYDLAFAKGGTRLFVASWSGQEILQYELQSPYDITSGVTMEVEPLNVSAELIRPTGLSINSTGTKMHLTGDNNGPPFDRPIEQYSLDEAGYHELDVNNGTVRGAIGISLKGETFTNQGGTLTTPTHFTITGVPSGLTPEITIPDNGAVGMLELNGNASPHESANDVADLVISFQDAAFSANDATAVLNTDNQSAGYGVTFLNNNNPIFLSSSTASFVENGTGSVLDVFANNGDIGAEDTGISYSISGGEDQEDFSIDVNSGVITFVVAPDFENPDDDNTDNTYIIEVTADDGELSNNTSTQSISITVTNVDDDPIFVSSATASFAENDTGTILDINANDGDGGSNDDGITYSLSGSEDRFYFNLNALSGVLEFYASPDFENPEDEDTNNTYEFTVTANDGVNAVQQNITITVTDVNESPVFVLPFPENPTFPENASSTIYDANANDGDGGLTDVGITYTIIGGSDQGLFDIDAVSGEVTFLSPPDFENPADSDGDNIYAIQINANDAVENTSLTVEITITDLDETPVFVSADNSEFIENSTEMIIDVDANDGDGGALDEGITYSIGGGADPARFHIDSDNGALTFVSPPDFEAPADLGGDNEYAVQIVANDGAKIGTQIINVTVTNLNEPPIFSSSNSVNFTENDAGAIININANDGDGGADDTGITYSLTGGTDQADFGIDANTGVLTFVSAPDFENPADADTNNDYIVQVTANDGVESTDQILTITVDDANEVPVFTSSATGNFTENGVGTVIDVNANDGDGGADDTGITYSLTGGTDQADFGIDANTGVLTFVSAPDFENPADADTNNDYIVQVTANDGVESTDQILTITVDDDNEVPVFTSSATGNFTENGVGTVIDVNANDGDGGADDTGITYSLTGGTDQADFGIDANTGVLTFVSAPDFENPADADTNNDYIVQVTANDGVESSNQTITVTVVNENESPVIINQTFAIDENSPDGTSVGTITASDSDEDALVYSITNGNTNDAFVIDSNSGELTVNTTTALDFETTPSFALTVEVNDGNGGTAAATITINLNDVDESGNTDPVISDQSFSIDENSPNGTSVGTVSASDSDGDALTFSIISGNSFIAFAINANSGLLTVNNTNALDYEARTGIDVIVEVNDGNGGIASAIITVNLNDIDESSNTDPVIANQTFTVDENSTNGTIVGTVEASDPDGDALNYSITNGNTNDAFTIDSSTGDLTVNNASVLDFETTPSFVLIVEVNDGNGGNASATITINLNDIDESSNTDPTISNQTFEVDENSPNGTLVGTVTASDSDGDVLAYSITNGNTNDAFTIDSSTGDLTVNNASVLDFETTPSFVLIVEVNDGNGGIVDGAITVNLLDLNEALGIDDLTDLVKVYPNPFNSQVVIELKEKPDDLKMIITDLSGKILMSLNNVSSSRTVVDFFDLSKGIYLLHVETEHSKAKVKLLRE